MIKYLYKFILFIQNQVIRLNELIKVEVNGYVTSLGLGSYNTTGLCIGMFTTIVLSWSLSLMIFYRYRIYLFTGFVIDYLFIYSVLNFLIAILTTVIVQFIIYSFRAPNIIKILVGLFLFSFFFCE
jgi:hypothetical protein